MTSNYKKVNNLLQKTYKKSDCCLKSKQQQPKNDLVHPLDKHINILTTDVYTNVNVPDCYIVELDLGCGKGAFTTDLAERYPDRLIYAVDVMLGRLRKLCKRNLRYGVENMQLLRAEAWYLVGAALPDKSIDRLHLLCPDPWPKEKHKGNRLVSSEFLGRLHNKLKKNGVFHFSTDDEPYYKQAAKTIAESNLFKKDDTQIADILDIKTDFEEKWNDQGLSVNHCAWIKD
jgi:tRNA (guanine-N7-)-methyltransferase